MSARADALKPYRAKRNFTVTPEPAGGKAEPGRRLVVQHHLARRDHYDLRLEIDGVLASWAVTRGPSANPRDKRLAVRTEDHPLSYGGFEGEIPKGEYGGGQVILWESATYSPLNGEPAQALAKGEIKFEAQGQRMRGGWVLVRMKSKEKRENWLLIKERDAFAEDDDSLTSRFPGSVNAKVRRRAALPPPAFQPLQLCDSATIPPEGPNWLYEIKYDGYRLEMAVGGEAARLYTRTGLDWTAKFPALAAAAAQLDCRSALLDGEAVVFAANGISDFPGLVAALERHRTGAVVYLAFDLLALDGRDLRALPLGKRKAALRKLLREAHDPIRLADHVEGEGREVFARAVAAGAEGIIAKDRTAPYVGRRAHGFVKVKGYPRADVVIVAYKPSQRRGTFASLHAAVEEDGEWRYVGGVGTGFSDAQRTNLQARFAKGASPRQPARLKGEVPPDLMFVKQPARAEIRFGGWTGSGHLRQARFLGLREDLPVTREPKPSKAKPQKTIAVTHADRVVYPDCGVTKGEIADYYSAVAGRLAPHLTGRPVSIVRAPETIAETFFQRHPLRGMEAGVMPVEVGDETYMALDGATGLATAAQFGAIELHGWMSRLDALDRPDRMVFDLDPDAELDFAEVVRAAQDIARALREFDLKSWPLLSGGKGVHVVLPLDGAAEYAGTEAFAKGFAQALAAHEPRRFVATMSKQRRKGRIFVDWLRNKKSATAILPWSLRARPGAPVATPLAWDELALMKSAAAFDIRSALKRSDPWRGFFTTRQRLPDTTSGG
jgi:bifunctional non-homologous end joining protein LigD